MFLLAVLSTVFVMMTKADKLAGVECDGTEEYVVPDPTYCDRYLSCPEEEVEVCQAGMVLDLNTGYCHKEELTNCNGREKIFRKKQKEQKRIISLRRPGRLTTSSRTTTVRAPISTTTKRIISLRRPGRLTNSRTATVGAPVATTSRALTTTTAAPRSRLSLFGSRSRSNYLSNSRHLNVATSVLDTATTEASTTTTTPTPTTTKRLQVYKTTPPPVDIDPFESVVCEDGDEYLLPDPTYCDRYLSCPEGKIEVCQDGLVLSLHTGFCSRKEETDCKSRGKLFRELEVEIETRLADKINEIEKENEEIMSSHNIVIKKHIETKSPKNLLLRRTDSSVRSSPSSTSKNIRIPSFGSVQQTQTISKGPKNLLRRKTNSDSSVRISSSSTSKQIRIPSVVSTPIISKGPKNLLRRKSDSTKILSSSIFSQQHSPISSSSKTSNQHFAIPSKSSSVDPLADVECEKTDEGYIVPDPEQCDRFAHCSTEGEKFFKLCPDGLVLSLTTGVCDYPYNVDCEDRTKLQSDIPPVECPSDNGNFPLPASESCRKYIDCKGGEGLIKSCGHGDVFDESLGCVHPDETDRSGCSSADGYEFECPALGTRLRFGDHDRVPHPTDCKKFYACFRHGKPRVLSCDKPRVFNPEKAICDDQDLVPGCENYYQKEKEDATVSRAEYNRIAQEIREQLIKEFGLKRL